MLTKEFGERLRKARKSRGLNQEGLGKLVGVGFQRISAYETGADIGLEMIEKLSSALDISPWELIKAPQAISAQSPVRQQILEKLELIPDEDLSAIDAVITGLMVQIQARKASAKARKDDQVP